MFTPPPTTLVPVFVMLSMGAGPMTIGACTLQVEPATHLYTALRWQVTVGFSTLAVPIPANVHLLGAHFHAVAAYTDPPTSYFGLAFSQQARIVIGD